MKKTLCFFSSIYLIFLLVSFSKVTAFFGPFVVPKFIDEGVQYSQKVELKLFATSDGSMDPENKGNSFFDKVERFYHELVPWGDPSKGFSAQPGKRDAMVMKYMERTGCSQETAEKEVDEYLADKEGYVIRKRAEEAKIEKEKK